MGMNIGQVEYTLSGLEPPSEGPKACSKTLGLFKEHSHRTSKHDVSITILHLSRCIQRHRGATLALLGGDDSFRNQVQTLQEQIATQFSYLNYMNQSAEPVLASSDYDQLSLGWLTIIKDWMNDNIHQSFEFHSHLLELISRISRQLLVSVLQPSAIVGDNTSLFSRMDKNYLQPLTILGSTCINELYELVEYLARIRGLGTHMAAMVQPDKDWQSRLEFWLQEFQYRKERFDQNIQLLPSPYIPNMLALKALQNLNMKLNYFLNLLNHEMASERSFQIPSHKLFLMGTEIIDGYLAIMDQANAVIRDQLYQMNQMCLERCTEL